MTDLGLQRLKEVIAYIEAHPEEWDQTQWCGTACCLASHAQRAAGKRPSAYRVIEDACVWLGLNYEPMVYLFDLNRTLADFHAFIAARGIPEDVK